MVSIDVEIDIGDNVDFEIIATKKYEQIFELMQIKITKVKINKHRCDEL